MSTCNNSCCEEEQSAGLSTAESEGFTSTPCLMERAGSTHLDDKVGYIEGKLITKEISNLSSQMKMNSLETARPSLSQSLGGSTKSLTNSAPTILVHTPDDNSYRSVHRPLRSAMSSRTLHESLHRGKSAGRNEKRGRSRSVVSFDQVNIREYERILGDNPSCTSGPPLSIGWRFSPHQTVFSVDDFEHGKGNMPRYKSAFLVPKAIRERVLKEHAGVSRREMVETVRGIQKQKSQRRKTAANLGMQNTEEKFETVRRTMQKAVGKRKPFSKEEKKLWDNAHERAVEKARQLEDSIRKGESISMRNVYDVGTPTNNMLPSRRSSSGLNLLATARLLNEKEEAKEEEEAPASNNHEVVSERVSSGILTQEPGSEPLRRSIVICEEDDDIFDKLVP